MPVAFESTEYPYSLSLPDEVVLGPWESAGRQWDGSEAISSTGAFVDRVILDHGRLYIAGTRWTDDLDSFVQHVTANVEEGHDCETPDDLREASIAGSPAVAYLHYCADTVFVLRVLTVRDGFGVVVMEMVLNAEPAPELDRLIMLLERFEWREN